MEKSFSGKPTSTRAKPLAGANLIYLLPDMANLHVTLLRASNVVGSIPNSQKFVCLFIRYYFMATYNFYIDG